MSKRYSDITANKDRKRANRAYRRSGPVNIGELIPLADRHNFAPQGSIVQRYVKSGREPGDTRVIVSRDKEGNLQETKYVAFKGGEGGRGWTVRSTKW